MKQNTNKSVEINFFQQCRLIFFRTPFSSLRLFFNEKTRVVYISLVFQLWNLVYTQKLLFMTLSIQYMYRFSEKKLKPLRFSRSSQKFFKNNAQNSTESTIWLIKFTESIDNAFIYNLYVYIWLWKSIDTKIRMLYRVIKFNMCTLRTN